MLSLFSYLLLNYLIDYSCLLQSLFYLYVHTKLRFGIKKYNPIESACIVLTLF